MQKISLFILFCCLSIASYGGNYLIGSSGTPSGTSTYCYGSVSSSAYSCTYSPCGSGIGTVTVTYQWFLDGSAVSSTHTLSLCSTCGGGTLTLPAGALNTYLTTTGAHSLTVQYSWSGDSHPGCSLTSPYTSSALTITVDNPSISVMQSAYYYCSGGTPVSLSASGGTSYSWSPDDGTLSALTGATVSASPIIPETYIVTGTDASGCSGTASATITPVSFYLSAAVTPTVACGTSTVTLTSNVQSPDYDFDAASPSSITYSWASVTGATTTLNTCAPYSTTMMDCDNGNYAPVPLPFTFEYFGTAYTSVNISANGFINFGDASPDINASSAFTIPAAPSVADGIPANMVALFMHNMDPDQGGTISYVTNGTAPLRTFVITYSGLVDGDGGDGTGNTCSGQIILHEGSNNIDLVIQSCIESDPVYDYPVTIGLQNGDGTIASVVYNNTNVSITNLAWHFDASGAPSSGVTYGWSLGGSTSSSGTAVISDTTAITLTVTDPTSGCAASATTPTVCVASNEWQSSFTSPTEWNNAINWGCNTVPVVTDNVLIPSVPINGTGFPVIASSAFGYANNLTVATGASITLNSSSALTVAGNMSNAGIISGAGTASLTGTAPSISGDGIVSNMTLNNATGATIANPAGGDSLAITGALTLSAGTLTTNGGLMLASSAAGQSTVTPTVSGYIAEIPGTNTSPISGDVIVQQHFAGNQRAYRMVGHPFNASIPLSQIEAYIDITGTGGATNGFTPTASDNPSCWWYNPLVGNSDEGFDPGQTYFTSTDGAGANAFNQFEGIMLFVRGAKGLGLDGAPYTPDSVSYRVYGTVNTGTVYETMVKGVGTATITPTEQDYNMLGNPYPSPVDIGTVLYNARTLINGSYFYLWNPYLGSNGSFIEEPIDGTSYYLGANEGFQVRTLADGNQLTYYESNKVSGPTDALMRHATPDYLSLYLYNKDKHLMDMLKVKFSDDATENEDRLYDAGKPPSPADVQLYSRSGNNTPLCVDYRPYADGKAIQLGLMTQSPQSFTLQVNQYSAPAGSAVYLHDKLLGLYTLLQQGVSYTFMMDSSSAQRDNRFELRMGSISVTSADQPGALEAAVTPNPASDEVTVSYSVATAAKTGITIENAVGQAVISQDLGMQQSGSVTIPISKLPAGVYIVTLTSGNDKIVKRLVKE